MTTCGNLPVLVPNACPKFYTCSAPICPIDPLWPLAAHLAGEPVCFYLRASGKAGPRSASLATGSSRPVWSSCPP